jgi:hypothetical protein
VVIAGPGIEIERIPGFDATGPNDSWGPSLEFPFIFEYKGPSEAELQDWLNDFASIGLRKNLAVPIRLLDGQVIGRWLFFDWGLTKIEPGSDGRKRYTLQAARPPDAELQFERDCCFSGFSRVVLRREIPPRTISTLRSMASSREGFPRSRSIPIAGPLP